VADQLSPDDFPAPREGFVITHVLVVADQDRSREYYRELLGGQVLRKRDRPRPANRAIISRPSAW